MEGAEKVDLAIIGAGWNGLMVAKVYLELHPGSKIVLLDRAASTGGVWAQDRLYPGLKSNNMLGTYEYPDFPMDPETFGVKPGQHIPGSVLHEYLTKFAKKFNIFQQIRFSTEVESAEKMGKDGWLLSTTTAGNNSTIFTKKLVVATGLTSEPFLPVIKGSESFTSPIFHAKDLQKEVDVIRSSKEVVILGGTKSAWDAAYAFAVAGGDSVVHMVIRESGHGPMWMAPPYVTPLKKWLEKLVHTRLLTWFSPCVWGAADGYTRARNFLHGSWFGRKITDTFWSILANDVLTLNGYDKHPETAKLKPWSNPFFLGNGLSILNYDTDFFDLVREGKIKVHIADVSSLSGDNVYLSNGERLHADALVCSTGWKHKPPLKFLPQDSDAEVGLPYQLDTKEQLIEKVDEEILSTFPRLKDQPVPNPKFTEAPVASTDIDAPRNFNQPYRLYRFMVPPSLLTDRTIAFAGVPATISTAIIASVQALWISAFFDDQLPIETLDQAHDNNIGYETLLHARFGKWRYPAGHGDKHPDFVFDALPYIDMLLQQLRLQSHRKNGAVAEVFQPYGPEDYRGLVDEWRNKTAA